MVEIMSWWSEHAQKISESPLIVGAVVAIATSLLSTQRKHPKMKFASRICEAATCAFISLGVAKAGMAFFDCSTDLVIPTSVFVSWIGTSELKEALNKIFLKYLGSSEK